MVSRIEAWKKRTRGDAFTDWGVTTESLPPGNNLPWRSGKLSTAREHEWEELK